MKNQKIELPEHDCLYETTNDSGFIDQEPAYRKRTVLRLIEADRARQGDSAKVLAELVALIPLADTLNASASCQDLIDYFKGVIADRQRRGEPKTEREKWLASLFPEDRMFEEIDQMARESYKRHLSLKRGQMIVRADSMDAHIIWATKRWIESNEPAPQPADPSGAPTLHNADSGAQNEIQATQHAQPAPEPPSSE